MVTKSFLSNQRVPSVVFQSDKTDLSFERTDDSPLLYRDCDINILLPEDMVVPKCPRIELLLEFTTLRPVRPGVVHRKI